jgi:hypothetical protein
MVPPRSYPFPCRVDRRLRTPDGRRSPAAGSARCRSAWSVYGWRGGRCDDRHSPRTAGMAAGAAWRDGRGSRLAGWPWEPQGRDGRGSRLAGMAARGPCPFPSPGSATAPRLSDVAHHAHEPPRSARSAPRPRAWATRRLCSREGTKARRRRSRGPRPAGDVVGCLCEVRATNAERGRPSPDPTPSSPNLGLAQRATARAAVGPRHVVKGRDLAALLEGATCRLRRWPQLAARRPGVRRAGHANAGADSGRWVSLQMTVGERYGNGAADSCSYDRLVGVGRRAAQARWSAARITLSWRTYARIAAVPAARPD